MTPSQFRQSCKEGNYTGSTSGCCPGYAQANLVILPAKIAADFEELCLKNPLPCPLLGKTEIGNQFSLSNKHVIDDPDFDLARDFPKYTLYENGKLVATPTDVTEWWDTKDHVGFLIGCSYSFETALAEAGLPPRNFASGKNVSMYKTTKRLQSAGVFQDVPYIVSMRPYKQKELDLVTRITGRFTQTHGAPIDAGYAAAARLGIRDLSTPDFGDPTVINPDEIPVFWGCGVTAQVAALSVHELIDGPIIGHAPGHMLVTDYKDGDEMSK